MSISSGSEEASMNGLDALPGAEGPIVGIGASAGGLEGLKAFFSSIADPCGMSFVVIQHLAPDHQSTLAGLLSVTTRMQVVQVTEPVKVKLDTVYVIAPDTVLAVRDGVLTPSPASSSGSQRQSINHFFRSLAYELRENAVGIVLSGAGSDGAMGLQSIKKFGGLTLAQLPETCRFDSMPRSALMAGVVDHSLPVEDMISQIISYFAFRAQNAGGQDDVQDMAASLPAIFKALQNTLGHDFSRYKQSTLIRRIRRRMQMLRIKPIDAYSEVLGKDPKEAEQLFRDLIIGVTEFFRDEEAFDLLSRTVLPKLFQQLDASGTLRIWVAGCATGEEAYSIAIMLQDYMRSTGDSHPVQIFATDIDADAVDTARQGFYKEEIKEQVSAERLARYFQQREGGYQVERSIREMCVFSVHNIIHDPPFSRMDMISCRNVLIYFDVSLQQRVLPLFRYALNPHGYLVLGPAESLGAHADLFHSVDKKLRIFQVKGSSSTPSVRLPRTEPGRQIRIGADSSLKVKLARERDARETHEQALLDWYVPPSVLLDSHGDVLHFARQTASFLQPPVGSPSNNIFDIIKDELRIALRTALTQARKDGHEITKRNVPIGPDCALISLVVRPLKPTENGHERFLVLFREEREEAMPEARPASLQAEEMEAVHQLEKELRLTKQWLQATVEELENSNEELKSSNEELISINEEYQAANEALQTSKEELQSLNEELETVNAELSKKVDEFDLANADLQSLFASSAIATIFLDSQLRIKRFTPAASELFSLIEGDTGRPLSDIAARFDAAGIVERMKRAAHGETVSEFEIQTPDDDSCYVCRINPTHGPDSHPNGIVLNVIDVTELKQAQAALQQSAKRKDEFLALLGHELRNPLAPLKMGLEALKHVDPSGAEAEEIFRIFQRQVDHLTKIVDELLDVSRISKGLILLRKEPVELSALITNTMQDYRAVFESRSIVSEVLMEDAPLWIEGDRTRLYQVLTNLLNNAVKFTPEGGNVHISLRQDGNFANISVKDSGRGLDPRTMDKLFQPFSQGEISIDRKGAGLGLGLALVKGLSELHKGSVSAFSQGQGLGATFVIRLPLTEHRPISPVEERLPEFSRQRIVIIEDNKDAASALELVLTLRGHDVVTAPDGKSGLEAVERHDAQTVICDIGLPGDLDGYEVARRLRQKFRSKPLLMVALSGYGQEDDKRKAAVAGFDRHLTKPMDMTQIDRIFGVAEKTET
jgi:two-component system CheB/CheR fusion protein